MPTSAAVRARGPTSAGPGALGVGHRRPRPGQDPVPWWGGFFGPHGVRLAGRLGMGLLAAIPELVPAYLAGLAAGGHPASAARYAQPWNIVLADPDAAWPRISEHLAYSWDSYGRYLVEGTDQPAPPPVDPEQMRAVGSGMGDAGAFFMVLTPSRRPTSSAAWSSASRWRRRSSGRASRACPKTSRSATSNWCARPCARWSPTSARESGRRFVGA